MTNKNKFLIYRYVVPVILFLALWGFITWVSPGMKTLPKLFTAGAIAYILSPRIRVINFRLGKNIQISWLFVKTILLPMDDSFKK